MVAGLEEISGGELHIGNRIVNDLEPAQRDIAMVFQNYALYPHMTNFENMAYGLKIAKVPKEKSRRAWTRPPRFWNWATCWSASPRTLRRPAPARGHGPRHRAPAAGVLFDEPLSNLDAKLRAQTRLEIQKLHRELGITSLFVTHDQVEAMTLAQRMIVMNAGNMEQFGTPEEVYHTPASTFVASFIGSPPMNLLKHAPNSKPGTILGIRPEHMDIGDTGWEVRVDTIELLGAERLVYATMGQDTLIVRIDEGRPRPSLATPFAWRPRRPPALVQRGNRQAHLSARTTH